MVLPFSDQGQLLEHVTELTALPDLVFSSVTRKAIDRLISEHMNASRLVDHGLRPSNRILFRGPPGTGKTATAGAIAKALEIPLVAVRQDALVSSYMGKTSSSMRLVFEFARANRAVMLLDEADGVASTRASAVGDGSTAEHNRVVASLLVMLEEQRRHSRSIVIAATNHDQAFDPAMWRRFDEVVTFPRPDGAGVSGLVGKLLKRHGYVLEPAAMHSISRAMRGMSFAEVERATLYAFRTLVMDDRATVHGALREAVRHHRTERAS